MKRRQTTRRNLQNEELLKGTYKNYKGERPNLFFPIIFLGFFKLHMYQCIRLWISMYTTLGTTHQIICINT